MGDELEPCPRCGALPCDWTDNPHTRPAERDAEGWLPITDWFARNCDRSNPKAAINTDPAYFGQECATAIYLALPTSAQDSAK